MVGEEEFHDTFSEKGFELVKLICKREKSVYNLASLTKGVFVNTLDPGIAGMALLGHASKKSVLNINLKHTHHDATGLGERSTSTKHILQRFFRICFEQKKYDFSA